MKHLNPIRILVARTSDSIGVNREEFWLNRLGIGLLLLGVAFLFKYSIDQGWIVPEVRVAFGIALGIVLFVLGWRLQQQRAALSQILIGGSIGTFYITGFAAYQLFGFLTYSAAFVWMVAVTVLAFMMFFTGEPGCSVRGWYYWRLRDTVSALQQSG